MPLRGLIRILLPSTPADIKLTDGCGTTHELLDRLRGKAVRRDTPIIMGSEARIIIICEKGLGFTLAHSCPKANPSTASQVSRLSTWFGFECVCGTGCLFICFIFLQDISLSKSHGKDGKGHPLQGFGLKKL